jgi:hypothetical protein
MPRGQPRPRPRWVIANEGTLEELRAAVQPILAELEQS